MTESIIVALVTAASSVIAVIITNLKSKHEMNAKLDKQQAITDTKLEELTREVREHNSFAQRLPVLEEQVKTLTQRFDRFENERN